MATLTGVLADTSVLARASNSQIAEQLARLRNEGRLWTCVVVTLELGYSARSQAEWQAIQSVQRLLPTVEVSAAVTRRARDVQRRMNSHNFVQRAVASVAALVMISGVLELCT